MVDISTIVSSLYTIFYQYISYQPLLYVGHIVFRSNDRHVVAYLCEACTI